MMTAKELRIGNYVLFRAIGSKSYKETIVDIQLIIIAEWHELLNEAEPRFLGISLTPRWFDRLGFEQCESPESNGIAWRHKKFKEYVWCNGSMYVWCEHGYVKITKGQNVVLHVHDIQSVIYRLTLEELIIDEWTQTNI